MASLRQRMLEDMQVRRLSACTQRTYVETVARFARYFDRSPARLGPEQIRAYQVYLTNERRLAPSSLVVAVSALRFLYRVTLQKRWVFDDMIPAPKKPRSLPVVLSPEEVVQFLDGRCKTADPTASRFRERATKCQTHRQSTLAGTITSTRSSVARAAGLSPVPGAVARAVATVLPSTPTIGCCAICHRGRRHPTT